MAHVLGVGGVFFRSRNPRKLARWYRDCLGVPLRMPSGAIFKPAGMPANSFTVWSVFPAASRYFSPSSGSFMVNFLVDDVDEALCQVELAGGTIVGKPKGYPYGRFGWFLDPDGNKVELWQPPPVDRANGRLKRQKGTRRRHNKRVK
jgi:predicted enzyme related to lactoylglutathione lyase